MASETYHEPLDRLSPETMDLHRAIVSLMEELEAIDWYQQRAEACEDDELRAVLTHNKNEEIEHAMMILEWLRRNKLEFDTTARTYLMTQGAITEAEARLRASGGSSATPAGGDGSAGLGIGSLKGE